MALETHFATWYREIDPEFSEERLQKRRASIDLFAENASLAEALDTVRLFFGMPTKNANAETAFRGKIIDKDSTFPNSGFDREVRVLAGCAAFHYATEFAAQNESSAVEFAFNTAFCKGHGGTPPILSIVEECQANLINDAMNTRSIDMFEPAPKTNPNIKPVLDTLTTENLPSHIEVGKKSAEGLEILGKSIRTNSSSVQKISIAMRLIQEEINILWWLFGERSHSANSLFSTNSPSANSLISAYDLALLSSVGPGPFAAEAFLVKAISLSKGKKIANSTIQECVSETPTSWSKDIMSRSNKSAVLDLCPIHSCLSEYARIDGDDVWIKGASINVRAELNHKIPIQDLSIQFFQESMLIRLTD